MQKRAEQFVGSLMQNVIERGLTQPTQEDVRDLRLFEADQNNAFTKELLKKTWIDRAEFAGFFVELFAALDKNSVYISSPYVEDNLVMHDKLSLRTLKPGHSIILTQADMEQDNTTIQLRQIEHRIYHDSFNPYTGQYEDTVYLRGVYRLPGGQWQSTSQLEGQWTITSGKQWNFQG